jgi:hypothetical protein
LSKIIQVGKELGRGPASGVLSGMTACGDKKGVTVDSGGVPATVQGDKETITAGGKEADQSVASTSVGGPVVPNKGEKQGGPNTKGTIAATAKIDGGVSTSGQQTPKCSALGINEAHKKIVRNMVKEVLKEIRFDKKSGKWVKLNEAKAVDKVSIEKNYGASQGGVEPNLFETDEIDENRFASMNPGSSGAQHPGGQLDAMLGDKEDEDNGCDCGAQEGPEHRPHARDCNVYGVDEELNMKMGPSFKRASHQYRVADDDHARATQYEPEITEMYNEADHNKMSEIYNQMMSQGRALSETETEEAKKIKEGIARMESLKLKNEAGGGAVQHSSFRTQMDMPQDPKNRHAGDIDESDEAYSRDLDPGGFVSAELKKMFTYKGISEIPFEDVEQAGLGHIQDVDKAPEYALNLAYEYAQDYGWTPDEKRGVFVKIKGGADAFLRGIKGGYRGASLEETEKKSEVVKTIQRGTKAKKSTMAQKLAHKGSKRTKSGIKRKRK